MEKSVTIYLVRHGQTELNKEKVFRGRLDPPLNNTGHEEARATAAFMKNAEVSFILSSPLLRAVQTAEPFARMKELEVKTVRDLIDIDFGKWQGLSEKKVLKRNSRLFHQWHKEPTRVTFPGGESLLKVRRRLEEFIEHLRASYAGRTGAVYTHRVVCKVMVCVLASIPLKNFWNVKIDTTSVSMFELESERTIVHFLNATSHLSRLAGRVTHDF
jgi:broad specificity phosphatase PhoE